MTIQPFFFVPSLLVGREPYRGKAGHQKAAKGQCMEDIASAVAEVPSAPSSSPTTTPASNEPTVTTDRPSIGDALKTFREAERIVGRKPRGQAPAPSSSVSPSPEGAAAIPPDGTTVAQPQPPARTGFVATADHIKAVENARVKVRAEVDQEYRSKYSTLDAMSRQYVEDRPGFIKGLLHEALRDPELAPQIRSLAGQTLRSQAPAPQHSEVEPPASPVFQGQDGKQYVSLEAQQAREDWLVRRIKAEVLGEVEPALQTTAEIKAEREAERANTQLKQVMTSHLTEARSWPYFTEHEADIKAALQSAPLTSGHHAEEALLLRRVYDRVVGPKLSDLERKRITADLQSRAHASTLNPASTAAPTGVPKNVQAKHGGTMAEALAWATTQTAGR